MLEIKKLRAYYNTQINNMAFRIEQAKESNKSRADLIQKKTEKQDLLNEIITYRDKLKVLRSRTTKENDEFRSRRTDYLNEIITSEIAEIFPHRTLFASIHCDFKRKDSVKLILKDDLGNEYVPFISNGKLLQYSLSFSSVSGIAEALGVKSLYIDEAFGVAAKDILSFIGDLIQNRVNRGFQILLVGQDDSLYDHLPRKQFNLSYELSTRSVKLVSVTEI